jgi:glutathione S-transferase
MSAANRAVYADDRATDQGGTSTVSGVIFHIAEVSDWQAAQVSGDYRVSTRGRTLTHEGFIHAARREQVLGVAEAFYADAGPLLLLSIDPTRLSSPVRDDEVAPGIVFPHIYGPIELEAVVALAPLERGTDGRFVLPPS